MTAGPPSPSSPDPASDPASPAPYPLRTDEQQALVRRRAMPLAICGLICGIGAIVLLLIAQIDARHPPAILAVNLSFCAMMMGAGILFWARGTKGTRAAIVTCVLAIITGFVGPLIYAKQTLDYRKSSEDRELANVAAIAQAARTYADQHGGLFPPDLLTMLQQHLLAPEQLRSPFTATAILPENKLATATEQEVEAHSDYQYFGGDLKLPGTTTQPAGAKENDAFSKILVASALEPIMRIDLPVSYADGRADFITLEEAETEVKTTNEARKSLGFAAMRPPKPVGRAMELEQRDQ